MAHRGSRSSTNFSRAPQIEVLLYRSCWIPTCRSTVDPDRSGVSITCKGLQIIRIVSVGPLRPRVVRGDEATELGWFSPSFGVRLPTDQILFEGHLDGPSTITIGLFKSVTMPCRCLSGVLRSWCIPMARSRSKGQQEHLPPLTIVGCYAPCSRCSQCHLPQEP